MSKIIIKNCNKNNLIKHRFYVKFPLSYVFVLENESLTVVIKRCFKWINFTLLSDILFKSNVHYEIENEILRNIKM